MIKKPKNVNANNEYQSFRSNLPRMLMHLLTQKSCISLIIIHLPLFTFAL